jgi:hypothetical protein
MQDSLSTLQDWKSHVLVDFSRQPGTENIPSSHTLSSNQKSERVSYSRRLLEALEEAEPKEFEHVITGDESLFFLYCPRDSL